MASKCAFEATTVLLLALLVLCPGTTPQAVNAEVVNDNTISTANLSRPARCLGCYGGVDRSGRFFDFDLFRRPTYERTYYRPDRYDDYYRSRVDSGYYGDRYYGRSNYYDYNYRGNGYDNLSPQYYNNADQYRDFGYNNYRTMDRGGYDSRYYRPYDETYRGSSGFDIQTGKGHYFAEAPAGTTHHSPTRPSDQHSNQNQNHNHYQHHNDHQQQPEHQGNERQPRPHPYYNSPAPQSDSYQNHPIPLDDHETKPSEYHYDSHPEDHKSADHKSPGSYPNGQFDHIHEQQLPEEHIATKFNAHDSGQTDDDHHSAHQHTPSNEGDHH